jgi:hypothetical protein
MIGLPSGKCRFIELLTSSKAVSNSSKEDNPICEKDQQDAHRETHM